MQTYRRSWLERFIAITVTVISLILLVLVTIEIFRSTQPSLSSNNSGEFFELVRPMALISTTMASTSSEKTNQDLANQAKQFQIAASDEPPAAIISDDNQTELAIGLDAAHQELNETRLALQATSQELMELRGNLSQMQSQQEADIAVLRAQMVELIQSRDAAVAENEKLRANIADTSRQLTALRQRNARLTKQLQSLEEEEAEALAAAEAVPQLHADAQSAYLAGDYDEAATIWRSLANNNDPRALFHLGSMEFEGRFANSNLLRADAYLTRSIAGGFGPALAMRERVRGAMTAEQRARVPSL